MPATFPAHQGAVLPLKIWRPAWFDGVALAVGAAAPDLAYLMDGSGLPVWPFSHQLLGLIGWCLPVTLVLAWLLRRAAPMVAVHLPRGGVLHLHDYAVLGSVRHRWWISASSAVLGGASHLGLDLMDGPMVREWAGHLLGSAAALGAAVHIGRRRLLLRWHGTPAPLTPRPARFWTAATVVTLAGVAVVPALPAAFLWHTTGVRLIAVAVAGLLAGAVLAGNGGQRERRRAARRA